MVETFGTGKISENRLGEVVREVFPLKPHEIVAHLELTKPTPKFRKTASYGHFGRSEPEFVWERTDMVEALKDKAGL